MINALPRLRLIPMLSTMVGILLATYVALMVATILFAALQTQLAQNIQDKQVAIGKLEDTYYDAITTLDNTNPYELGYVTPKTIQYVAQSNMPGLSFAR